MYTSSRTSAFVGLIGGVILAAVFLLALSPPSQADLPPRPTNTPPPQVPVQSAQPGPAGGFVELGVQFPATWSWKTTHWQDLWTVVQWQDDQGHWHAVTGWQGGLDGITTEENGAVVGHKTWWAAQKDLGTGPFRWQVYRGKGGSLLATSEPFDLPGAVDAIVSVELSIE